MKRIYQSPYSQCREASTCPGVSFDEPNGKWVARYEGKHLGYFDEENQAIQAINLLNKII